MWKMWKPCISPVGNGQWCRYCERQLGESIKLFVPQFPYLGGLNDVS